MTAIVYSNLQSIPPCDGVNLIVGSTVSDRASQIIMADSSGWWTTERGLLPNLIRREKIQETTPFIVLANPEGIVYEFTYADIENASNRAAWLLEKATTPDEEKVFYMGRMDLRYLIWAIAAMKAGKCVSCTPP